MAVHLGSLLAQRMAQGEGSLQTTIGRIDERVSPSRRSKSSTCRSTKRSSYSSSTNIRISATKIFKNKRRSVRIPSTTSAGDTPFSRHCSEEVELHRTLQSLACGKIRLLIKKPMVSRDDRPATVFMPFFGRARTSIRTIGSP